jgi:hypothetical protein
MTHSDDRLTALLKSAASSAEQHHPHFEADEIIAEARRRRPWVASATSKPRRRLPMLPRAVAVCCLAAITVLGVLVAIRQGGSNPQQHSHTSPAATTTPRTRLTAEFPRAVAESLGWIETHERGLVAGPTWLPVAASTTITPYISTSSGSSGGQIARWQVLLSFGGSGHVTVGRGGSLSAGAGAFAVISYSSDADAEATFAAEALRPAGASSLVDLRAGVSGYLHTSGPSKHQLYWTEGSWQFDIGFSTAARTLQEARTLVAYIGLHPLPAGAGKLLAVAGGGCRVSRVAGASQVEILGTTATASGCIVTNLARMMTSVRAVG